MRPFVFLPRFRTKLIRRPFNRVIARSRHGVGSYSSAIVYKVRH
jgi:hypothetical protein